MFHFCKPTKPRYLCHNKSFFLVIYIVKRILVIPVSINHFFYCYSKATNAYSRSPNHNLTRYHEIKSELPSKAEILETKLNSFERMSRRLRTTRIERNTKSSRRERLHCNRKPRRSLTTNCPHTQTSSRMFLNLLTFHVLDALTMFSS